MVCRNSVLRSTSVFLSLLIFFLGSFTSSDSSSSYSASPSSAENSTLSALLHFKASIVPDGDQLSSWNTSSHFCQWQGIVCANSSHQVKELHLSQYDLRGVLSPQIGNLQGLSYLDLSYNYLSGPVPTQLGNLQGLSYLNLSYNYLGGAVPTQLGNLAPSLAHLDLSHNSFTGALPDGLMNCSNLILLDISVNSLSSHLPSDWSKLASSLQQLNLQYNNFNITSLLLAPASFFNLTNLRILSLAGSTFSGGGLFEQMKQLTSLKSLDLSVNRLTGKIPPSLGQMISLQQLDLSDNQLSGPLPSSLGQMFSLQQLDLSYNQLSGPLPSSLGQMKSLQNLQLSQNRLSGPLPSSLGQMISLQQLDLSRNQLSGPLPSSLHSDHLVFLDVSYNRLEGMIPMLPSYQSFPSTSFLGNPGLCGPPLITSCTSHSINPPSINPHSKRNMKLYVLVILMCVVGAVSLMLAFLIYAWRHFFNKRDPGSDFVVPEYKAWTTEEMRVATNDFDVANVIGSGAVSMCYLGVMKVPEGMSRVVALKRLTVDDYDGEEEEGRKSFVNEFKTLCKMRHRNLVKVLGYCVEGGEIALVMEYMEKGDLHRRLHSETRSNLMRWEERVNVALDVAEGLVYLHHEYEQPIIHCDVKPKNILLTSDMVAKISDFGIAKLLQGKETGDMSMSKFRGTFGYIAPEYGMGSRISTKVDVYSYGMLLLELVTGVRPTSPMLEEEAMSLRTWVVTLQASGRIREALRDYDLDILQEAEELLRLAVQCTHDVAKKRPTMYIVRDSILQLKKQGL